MNTNTGWRDKVDVSKIASIFIAISMAFLALFGSKLNLGVAHEQRVEQLVKGLAPDEEKEKIFSAYVSLRCLFSEEEVSRDEKVQKLLSRQIFLLILQQIYPDRNVAKNFEMLERLQIVDMAINHKESTEFIFAKILFQKENEEAIEEFTNFIKLHPKHWLIPWAYFNIASTLSDKKDTLKALEYKKKAIDEARRLKYEDADIAEMSK
ncbi:MAG: hypothetical protein HY754_11255 [Nitrospirae bacterium]|nr:hypothetical protein [Nitrospirota bacterium]